MLTRSLSPLRLALLTKDDSGNGFVLRLQRERPSGGVEFLVLDRNDRVLMRTAAPNRESGLHLCNGVIAIIKQCDPTALIITDIDLELDTSGAH